MSDQLRPRSDSVPSLSDTAASALRRRQYGPSALQLLESDDLSEFLAEMPTEGGEPETVAAGIQTPPTRAPPPEPSPRDADDDPSKLAYNRVSSYEVRSGIRGGFLAEEQARLQRQRTKSEGIAETLRSLQRRGGDLSVGARLFGSQADVPPSQRPSLSDGFRRLNTVQSSRTPAQYAHQMHELNAINCKQYRYRGVVVLRNALDQEYDMFDIVPDEQRVRHADGVTVMEHTIYNVDLALRPTSGNVDRAHTVAFYYFLRASGSDRYDCLLAVTFRVNKLASEMQSLLSESPGGGDTPMAFETVLSHGPSEVVATVGIAWEREARTAGPASPKVSAGQPYPIIRHMTLRHTLTEAVTAASELTMVTEPRLSTKTLQNFWFRMEIERRTDGMTDDAALWSPFTPIEQHISMSDSHYYVEQEIALENFSILQGSPSLKNTMTHGNSQVYVFRYFVRERTPETSSQFCLAALEVSLAEVIECSFAFQRLRNRFKLEKYVALGMVRATFHFFVREELHPSPESSETFVSPERGNWLLERISIGIRVV